MANQSTSEIITCPQCGKRNKVTTTYSNFGPANQERETGNCRSCGNEIASEKCLGISVELVDD